MATSSPPQPETPFGKYRLIARIATGGMAELFLAKAPGLPGFDRVVVIKRILPHHADDATFVRMFIDEARVASTLQHPNIVQVHDVGCIDGRYFMVMEHLRGGDLTGLAQALAARARSLPLEHAVHIVAGLCAGLHYAHEKRDFEGRPLAIVHRDVSPQNVFVTLEGAVKVLDFGIAKAVDSVSRTRASILKGKVPFMSPEQAQSLPLDRRSDVFSAGILLWELTTGKSLFRGRGELETMNRIVTGPYPRPSEVRPGYDPDLEAIVGKALSIAREARHQTAEELQADLERFARSRALTLSSLELARLMKELLGDGPEPVPQESAEAAATRSVRPRVAGEPPVDVDLDGGEGEGEGPNPAADMPATEVLTPLPWAGRAAGAADPALRRGRRRRALTIAAVVVLAGAALAVLLRPGSGGRSSPATGASTIEAGPAAAAGADAAPARADAAAPRPGPDGGNPPGDPGKTSGAVRVATRPPGARLTVDGRRWRKPAPALVDGLAPGEHTIRADHPHHEPVTERVRVEAGASRDVVLRLKPHPGELRIKTTPSCQIYVDGELKGWSPVPPLRLAAGAHKVRLVNRRFGIDRTEVVWVAPDAVAKRDYRLPAIVPK